MTKMLDEGYIKFNCDWTNNIVENVPQELIDYRNKVKAKNWIGVYEKEQIGFGNISIKTDKGFIISGTQTAFIEYASSNDFVLVDDYNLVNNSLHCIGELKASSESLTHAACYEMEDEIQAIIHIHHTEFWNYYKYKLPTVSSEIPYGTVEMALAMKELYQNGFKKEKIAIMAGHEDGVFAIGKDLEECFEVLELFFTKIHL